MTDCKCRCSRTNGVPRLLADFWQNIRTRFLGPPAAAAPDPKSTTTDQEPEQPHTVVSEKDLATQRGEPWVQVTGIEVDPGNLHQGSFGLDWNEIFVARLIKAGYMAKPQDTDADIVDRWFQNICRHVVMETWEQEQSIQNSGVWVQRKDIGNGRSEIS